MSTSKKRSADDAALDAGVSESDETLHADKKARVPSQVLVALQVDPFDYDSDIGAVIFFKMDESLWDTLYEAANRGDSQVVLNDASYTSAGFLTQLRFALRETHAPKRFKRTVRMLQNMGVKLVAPTSFSVTYNNASKTH